MLDCDVLIVEDELLTLEYIRTTLVRNGVRVIGTAIRGEDAVELALRVKPQLVLMDIHLQDEMDGIEAARLIRAQLPIPIVFLTAYTEESVTSRAAEISPYGYLTKPFKEKDLLLVLKIALFRSEIERKLLESERSLAEKNRELAAANDRIQVNQSMLVQQEKLASIGHLAAGVAHELNNPIGFISSNMSSMQMYVQSLKAYLGLLEAIMEDGLAPEEVERRREEARLFKGKKKISFILNDVEALLNESLDGAARITDIVRNLRTFSRVDFDENPTPYDLREGIRSTLVVARNEIKYLAEVETDFEEVPAVPCFSGEINQVVLNILVNAAQAIKEQHRPEKGLIRIRLWQEGEYICCRISDDGPGIKPEILSKVFDPFFTTKEVGKGTGLGLSISYNIIVHKHKGRLTVDSQPGQGAAFTIALPIENKLRGE